MSVHSASTETPQAQLSLWYRCSRRRLASEFNHVSRAGAVQAAPVRHAHGVTESGGAAYTITPLVLAKASTSASQQGLPSKQSCCAGGRLLPQALRAGRGVQPGIARQAARNPCAFLIKSGQGTKPSAGRRHCSERRAAPAELNPASTARRWHPPRTHHLGRTQSNELSWRGRPGPLL